MSQITGQSLASFRLMEPWVIALVSAAGGAFVGALSKAYWFGRNTPTVADLHELRDLAIAHRDELKGDIAAERRYVGETLLAMRQHIQSVEIDLAKNYLRRDSWHQAMGQLQESISKSDQADQQWKLRIEEKIDRLFEKAAER